MQEAHEKCVTHNALFIKEEGNTSQVNQAYDQKVAKGDKMCMQAAIDMLSPAIRLKKITNST